MEQFAWHDCLWLIPNLVLYLSVIGFWIYTNITASPHKYYSRMKGLLSFSHKWRKQQEGSHIG